MSKPPKQSGNTPGAGGQRALTVKVRTAKRRKISSTRWLQRQLNDPYVVAAKREGYKSRAAFKLVEIDDQHTLLTPGAVIIDLGAAPGGWSQVSAARVKSETGKGAVVAMDITAIEPIAGVTFLHGDFMEADAPDRLIAALQGRRADAVLSDMASPATGHKRTDHLRIMGLCEAALEFAIAVLAPNGTFLCKVLQGGTATEMLATMKREFKTVRHVKPKASRADSAELYVLATGFRGKSG